jgi:hypothetical protein
MLVNADTGERLEGVTKVTIVLDAHANYVSAIVEVINVPVDAVVQATLVEAGTAEAEEPAEGAKKKKKDPFSPGIEVGSKAR